VVFGFVCCVLLQVAAQGNEGQKNERDDAVIWEGLNDHQLCELFKDPNQNGNRSVGQIVEHVSTPLVLWGWNPGDGRTPVPMPEAQFLAKVKEWAAKGAACPADGSSSPTNGR
jgi:hypothetical protein